MATIAQIQRGVAQYIDTELLPKMEGKDKWIMSALGTLYLAKLPALVQTLAQKEAVKILGIVGADGSVDVDALIDSVRPAARQSSASFSIPFGGTIKLTEADLDTVRKYIANA